MHTATPELSHTRTGDGNRERSRKLLHWQIQVAALTSKGTLTSNSPQDKQYKLEERKTRFWIKNLMKDYQNVLFCPQV
ncbi:hypothetical protein AAFF_G00029600 [Aldrovandia affinis]|uniref:Uncharacterized protein n=1 Tax=Aldrovandia affinis TaxID=143900 RepID=A0AAD7S4D9_9TELE|nr:hypothetical protein AAFF_G00029600 [Aldrovandia affinis]